MLSVTKIPFCTYFLLALCALLYFIDAGTTLLSPSLPAASTTAFSPLKKTLLFDYPHAIALEDILIEKEAREPLSLQDEPLIKELYQSSFWGGLSLPLFVHLTGLSIIPHPSSSPHLLFEMIRQGQVWRLFTPALLHGSFLHLLFNMTWLYVLGKQIEVHIGAFRYLLFILLTGIFSNTAQYLLGGYAFLGFSGVLFAMAAFIATRQRLFPQEGFFLEKSLYRFLVGTVVVLTAISLILFLAECTIRAPIFSVGLANGAHIIGLLSGMWLGRWRFFSAQSGQIYPQN